MEDIFEEGQKYTLVRVSEWMANTCLSHVVKRNGHLMIKRKRNKHIPIAGMKPETTVVLPGWLDLEDALKKEVEKGTVTFMCNACLTFNLSKTELDELLEKNLNEELRKADILLYNDSGETYPAFPEEAKFSTKAPVQDSLENG